MITYYERVPSAAAYRNIDGNLYANSLARVVNLPDGRLTIAIGERVRMMRVSYIQNGEAYVQIATAGAAIANVSNLPFGITAFAIGEESR
jgi:hypothetical protein